VFSSLDRVDIVLQAGPDGRPRYVQTDHRTAEEVESESALSVLFALVRVLNPRRQVEAGAAQPIVLYLAQSRPPEFLCQAIRAAGGLLVVGSGRDLRPEPDEGDTPPLEEVIDSAFADLAHAVAMEHGVQLTLEGLETVERSLASVAGGPEEDEVAYWSAVVKLGAFGGELIRASNGGQWTVVASGSLPFALTTNFRGEEATVNPLGKAIKRFAQGEGDSLVTLVNLILGSS
jgi:hypothetical protein